MYAWEGGWRLGIEALGSCERCFTATRHSLSHTDKREGQGILKLPDGSEYEGEFEDDDVTGWGELRVPAQNLCLYRGTWRRGKRSGRGA